MYSHAGAGATVGVSSRDDAYLVWFSAEHESARALRAWWGGDEAAQATAYAAYRAALDREEAAARELERLSSLSAYPS
jgi:hypothetical protein